MLLQLHMKRVVQGTLPDLSRSYNVGPAYELWSILLGSHKDMDPVQGLEYGPQILWALLSVILTVDHILPPSSQAEKIVLVPSLAPDTNPQYVSSLIWDICYDGLGAVYDWGFASHRPLGSSAAQRTEGKPASARLKMIPTWTTHTSGAHKTS